MEASLKQNKSYTLKSLLHSQIKLTGSGKSFGFLARAAPRMSAPISCFFLASATSMKKELATRQAKTSAKTEMNFIFVGGFLGFLYNMKANTQMNDRRKSDGHCSTELTFYIANLTSLCICTHQQQSLLSIIIVNSFLSFRTERERERASSIKSERKRAGNVQDQHVFVYFLNLLKALLLTFFSSSLFFLLPLSPPDLARWRKCGAERLTYTAIVIKSTGHWPLPCYGNARCCVYQQIIHLPNRKRLHRGKCLVSCP